MEFIDIKAQYNALKEEINTAVFRVLESGHFVLGEEVQMFEEQLSTYLGIQHVVSCGNGTDALELIFRALDVKDGDAIFVPDITFIASIGPACSLGATPIFCDIDIYTFNLSSEALDDRIKQVLNEGKLKPKCIVAVDFLGNPCNYLSIKKIAKKYNMMLIEDAAQSFGADYQGEKCGTLGDYSMTSFFPTKPLGCFGDGGAVFTDDENMTLILKSLRAHGSGSNKYDNVRLGMNSRLDALQAAILSVKLNHIDIELKKRRELAGRYNQAFRKHFVIQKITSNCNASYAQYSMIASSEKQRDHIMNELKICNIPSLVYYPTPLHRLPVFENSPYSKGDFNNSDKYASTSFAIPFSPYMEPVDQDRIINCVLKSIGVNDLLPSP